MSFRVFDASQDLVFFTDVTYTSCSEVEPEIQPLCRDDGIFADEAIYVLASISATTPIPVELTSFEAVGGAGEVLLRWTTASEQDNAGFEVQQRPLDVAASEWTVRGFVEGEGTRSTPTTYSLPVTNLPAGRHAFRLKQLDFDGTFAFSPTVTATVTPRDAVTISAPSPNPFRTRSTLSVTVKETQTVNVTVYDVVGRPVAVLHDGTLPGGRAHRFDVDGSPLASGVYFVRVQGPAFSEVHALTVVR